MGDIIPKDFFASKQDIKEIRDFVKTCHEYGGHVHYDFSEADFEKTLKITCDMGERKLRVEYISSNSVITQNIEYTTPQTRFLYSYGAQPDDIDVEEAHIPIVWKGKFHIATEVCDGESECGYTELTIEKPENPRPTTEDNSEALLRQLTFFETVLPE